MPVVVQLEPAFIAAFAGNPGAINVKPRIIEAIFFISALSTSSYTQQGT
jgi:hypothetical protein